MVEGVAYVLKIPETIGLIWIIVHAVKCGLWIQRVRARGESIFSAIWKKIKDKYIAIFKWRV